MWSVQTYIMDFLCGLVLKSLEEFPLNVRFVTVMEVSRLGLVSRPDFSLYNDIG